MSKRTNIVVLLGSLYDYENNCAVDPVFLRDLKIFSSLPSDQMSIVLDQLRQAESYEIVKSIVSSEFETDVSDSFLRLVELFTPAGTDGFLDWFAGMRASSDVVLKEFPDNEWEKFQKKFHQWVREFVPVHCVASHIKGKNLQTILGDQFQDVEIICDIRPIFDNTLEIIEDCIPVTTLKMTYLSQTSEVKVLEVVLSEDDIDVMDERITTAKKKLRVLRDTFVE